MGALDTMLSPERMEDMVVVYRMEIVGGPFDGVGAMRWHDDGQHSPPEMIFVGVCAGNGQCNTPAVANCAARGKHHPYYWTPDEDSRPPKTTQYDLSECFIDPETLAPPAVTGRAIYVIGALDLPRERDEHALVGDRGREVHGIVPSVYAQGTNF